MRDLLRNLRVSFRRALREPGISLPAVLVLALAIGAALVAPPSVIVLGDGLWRERFGGDPGVVGRTLHLDGTPFTVIGIAPPGFRVVMPLGGRLWTRPYGPGGATLAVVGAVTMLVGAVASLLPARAATRVQPSEALRTD